MSNTTEFDRSKIYEKLDYKPEPAGYSGKIPWRVQQQISATNGIHYKDTVGKLDTYPIPEIPLEKTTGGNVLLDIGCGWGRWLVSAAQKNYIPVGADLRLEFCEISQQVLKDHNINGYTVVADLKELPFKEGVFDVVWSFSVIQHTHKSRLLSCIKQIHTILKAGGFCMLEFPNRSGLRNRMGPVQRMEENKDDYNSWNVRYYTIKEYRKFFVEQFTNFSFRNHSFLGIGILPNDIKYAKGLSNKLGIGVSLLLSKVAEAVKPLTHFSDSIYIKCFKNTGSANKKAAQEFLALHANNPGNNLNVIPLLRCPISGGELVLDKESNRLVSQTAKVSYPIVNNIPILIASESTELRNKEEDKLNHP